MSIGANVRKYRTEKGISQKELAEAVGVTQSMIAQIERGTKSLSMELGNDISAVLGITVMNLLEKNAGEVEGKQIPAITA